MSQRDIPHFYFYLKRYDLQNDLLTVRIPTFRMLYWYILIDTYLLICYNIHNNLFQETQRKKNVLSFPQYHCHITSLTSHNGHLTCPQGDRCGEVPLYLLFVS